MTRVLLDTNVVLDVLLRREPWHVVADRVLALHQSMQIEAYVTASSITDVFYVARRLAGREKAWRAVEAIIDQLYIISVGSDELRKALVLDGDFEDRLQGACAIAAGLDFIVTRDLSGFADSVVPAISPPELLTRLSIAE